MGRNSKSQTQDSERNKGANKRMQQMVKEAVCPMQARIRAHRHVDNNTSTHVSKNKVSQDNQTMKMKF